MRKTYLAIYNSQQGFTLIEALLAAIVFAVVGVIAVNILSNVFQGSNKAQLISHVKQSGQSALNIIDNNIRNADSVICPTDSTPSNVLVTSKNGSVTRFKLYLEGSLQNKNGYIGQDFPTLGSASAQDLCDADLIQINPSELTDTNLVSGVSVISGQFMNNAKSGYRDIINVSFSLAAPINSPKSGENQIEPITFATTISLK